MRKTNKLLSLLLTLCMMISVFMPLTANAAITFSDVPSTHTYYKAITNLAAEGVLNGFEDGTFKPEDPVTRAQFTKIICYALGSGTLQYGAAQRASFPDVDPNHWAIDNITTAYNSKIINGYDDGTFKPENSVLYEQAVKMAVCALGYPSERADRFGGYPNGYIKIASDIKMLKDLVGVKTGEPLNRGGVAQLIDNMCDAEIYAETTSNGNQQDGGTLRENNATTVLQAEGRIVSVYGTSIYYGEEPECNKKQIELELNNGDRVFFGIENLGISDTSAYLGRSVVVYYEHDNSADYDEASNIAFQKKKNNEITISLDDIEGMDGDELQYYVDDEEEPVEISIDPNICIILNGASVGDDFEDVVDEALSKSGSVTLVCSMDNEVADVAFVETYETIVVGSKDTKNYKIYDYYNPSKSFTLDDTERGKSITFTKDGKSSSFSAIATNNIVSVSVSEDESIIDVQISSKTKAGTVTDIMANDRIKLSSDSKLYRFTDTCYRGSEITPGAYVTLYLDAFGNVARYVISAEKAYTYGYLAAAEDGSMTDPKVEVLVYKLSTSSAAAVGTQYSLKDNVRIDGKVYSVSKNATEIMKYLESTAAKANINASIQGTEPVFADYSQPIRFTTSSSNVIDSILTTESTGEFNVSMNMTYHMEEPVLCRVDRTTLGEYSISSSVPILLVPTDRMDGDYMTRNNAYFKKDESYYVQLVNVSSTKQPAAIYVYGTGSAGSDVTTEALSEDHIPMMVTDISEVSYQEEIRTCLKLLGTDNVAIDVYDDGRKNTEAIADVKRGDIVRVAADSEKMIDAIEIIATAEDIANGDVADKDCIQVDGTSQGQDENDAPLRVVIGLVASRDGNVFVVKPSFASDSGVLTETYTYNENVKVYLIDTQTSNDQKLVSECTYGEVIDEKRQPGNGSHVMIYTEKGNLKAIIVVK